MGSEQVPLFMNSLLVNLTSAYGSRFVFSLNIYPYFDELGNRMDPDGHRCLRTVYEDVSFNSGPGRELDSKFVATARVFRRKMTKLTMNPESLFWVGEYGWSHPRATTLQDPMASCKDFNSLEALASSYTGFLAWNMSLPEERPPDHAFYFTVRDSFNVKKPEYFGLVEACGSPWCKLRCDANTERCPHVYCWVTNSSCEVPAPLPTPWQPWSAFLVVPMLFIVAGLTWVGRQKCSRRAARGGEGDLEGRLLAPS